MVECSTGIVDGFLSSSEFADDPEALKKSVEELREVLSTYELTAGHAKVRPPQIRKFSNQEYNF